MSLTIEKPETEARLMRYATSRGISPVEALDELLDEVEEEDLQNLPDILTRAAPDELQNALDEMATGQWVSGEALLAELKKPLSP